MRGSLALVLLGSAVGCSSTPVAPVDGGVPDAPVADTSFPADAPDTGSDGSDAAVPPCVPATLVWSTTTALPSARESAAAAVLGGKVVVSGGFGSDALADVIEASITGSGLGAWTARSPLPTKTEHHAMTVVGGRLLVVGGDDGVAVKKAAYVSTAIGGWLPVTDLPEDRVTLAAVGVGNQVVVAGGSATFGGVASTSVWIGTLSGDTIAWTPGPALPAGRAGHAMFAVGPKIYAVGGSSTAVFAATLNGATLGAWQTETALTKAVSYHGAAAVGGRAYVVGGGLPSTKEAWSSPLGTLSWTIATDLPSARFAHAMAASDDRLFVLGGFETLGQARDTVFTSKACQ